jgi:hypothetical protein
MELRRPVLHKLEQIVPWVFVATYAALYISAWYQVMIFHRTDSGDGLEYMFVYLLTLPWVLPLFVIDDVLLAIPFELVPDELLGLASYALVHLSALLNATFIFLFCKGVVRLIGQVTARYRTAL